MGGVRDCHRGLIVDGEVVVSHTLVAAIKPFTPSTAPSTRAPNGRVQAGRIITPPTMLGFSANMYVQALRGISRVSCGRTARRLNRCHRHHHHYHRVFHRPPWRLLTCSRPNHATLSILISSSTSRCRACRRVTLPFFTSVPGTQIVAGTKGARAEIARPRSISSSGENDTPVASERGTRRCRVRDDRGVWGDRPDKCHRNLLRDFIKMICVLCLRSRRCAYFLEGELENALSGVLEKAALVLVRLVQSEYMPLAATMSSILSMNLQPLYHLCAQDNRLEIPESRFEEPHCSQGIVDDSCPRVCRYGVRVATTLLSRVAFSLRVYSPLQESNGRHLSEGAWDEMTQKRDEGGWRAPKSTRIRAPSFTSVPVSCVFALLYIGARKLRDILPSTM